MSSRATRAKHGAYFIHAQHCPRHATCYSMCSDVMCTLHGTRTQASWPPLLYVARQEVLMGVLFAQAELYLSKITASHFSTLNTKIANQNVLERILIAMLNENTAVSNENFRICSEESVAPLYKW